MTALAPVLAAVACLGYGALILKTTHVQSKLETLELISWAFALGLGVFGWILFWLGIFGLFSKIPFVILLCIGAVLSTLLFEQYRTVFRAVMNASFSPLEISLAILIVCVISFDFVEALAPPADADSMAYHFALPKLFLEAGVLEFVPRAIDGAAPLLVQMTYVPLLAIGGETSMTLWVMLTGFAAVGLLYTASRRFLSRPWSMALALILMTTPAMIYGAGTGQIEVRNILFVIVAAVAAGRAIETGDFRFAVIAGFAAGFFVGAKYTGLIFAFSVAVVLLFQREWFRHGLLFCLCVGLAGFQWYAWNFIHTGDPMFPVLFNVLKDVVDYAHWDQAHADVVKDFFFTAETPVPRNVLGFISYPFIATFADIPILESSRVGLGPFGALVAPFVLLGLWLFRDRLRTSPLLPLALIVLIFYTIWFFAGSPQRVRHLLPIYPMLLLVLAVVGVKFAVQTGRSFILACVFVLSLGVQFAGVALFSVNPIRYVMQDEDREVFLTRNLSGYKAVEWINQNLGSDVKVMTAVRQLIYHLETPYYYDHTYQQIGINRVRETYSFREYARQVREQGITHVLAQGKPERWSYDYTDLYESGCARIVTTIESNEISSRALSSSQLSDSGVVYHTILEISWSDCNVS